MRPLALLLLLAACAGDDVETDPSDTDTDTDTDTETDTDTDTASVEVTLDLPARAAGSLDRPFVIGTVEVEGVSLGDLEVNLDAAGLSASLTDGGRIEVSASSTTAATTTSVEVSAEDEVLASGTLDVRVHPDRTGWNDWRMGGRGLDAVVVADDGTVTWAGSGIDEGGGLALYAHRRKADGSSQKIAYVTDPVTAPCNLTLDAGAAPWMACRVASPGVADVGVFRWGPDVISVLSNRGRWRRGTRRRWRQPDLDRA